jgi:general nucleoside transport system ATP-binding protein
MKINKLEMIKVNKRFSRKIANDDVSFSIRSGEVLALLGENGAGKTTLMNILFGIVRADSGTIKVNDIEKRIPNASVAASLGIGMIHQHFMLVSPHSVIENIALGLNNTPFFFPERKLRKKLETFISQYGFSIPLDAKIWELSAGEQQRVEIIKVLMQGAEVLILDEPTSVLTPQEVKELFSIIKRLKQEGKLIIFITHKLEEIMEIADRVLVLRQGQVVGEKLVADTSPKELAKMMVGKDILFKIQKQPVERGELLLQIKNLSVMDDRNISAVKNLSFLLYKNQIFGIAGVSGNGQKELVEAIAGLRKVQEGSILFNEKNITSQSAKQIHHAGISHIPEERIRYGVVSNMLVTDNVILKKYDQPPFSRKGCINQSAINKYSSTIVNDYHVSVPSLFSPVKNLSGGNIQKLILGREMSGEALMIIASHPTYGLDISATQYIWEQLLKKRIEGSAILLVSEDLEELYTLADIIAVMFEGKFMGIVDPTKVPIEQVGLLMGGHDIS